MNATVGDWLLVKSTTTHRPARRGEILRVGPDGRPPFTVRWTDSDHEVLVFPGPDAAVVSPTRLAAMDRQQTRQITDAQSSTTTHR